MLIYVMHDLTDVYGVIENYESLIWTMQFYGPGDFELVIPYDQDHDICTI